MKMVQKADEDLGYTSDIFKEWLNLDLVKNRYKNGSNYKHRPIRFQQTIHLC